MLHSGTYSDRKPRLQEEFYPRVINKTDITFTNDELTLCNKGLKYDINQEHKNWI